MVLVTAPTARLVTPKTMEADTADALDAAVSAYLSTLTGQQKLLHYDVRPQPGGSGYFATLLTAGA